MFGDAACALVPGDACGDAVLYNFLRPELVMTHATPLSADAFTRWGEHDAAAHNPEVRSLSERVRSRMVPSLARRLVWSSRAAQGYDSESAAEEYEEADAAPAARAPTGGFKTVVLARLFAQRLARRRRRSVLRRRRLMGGAALLPQQQQQGDDGGGEEAAEAAAAAAAAATAGGCGAPPASACSSDGHTFSLLEPKPRNLIGRRFRRI